MTIQRLRWYRARRAIVGTLVLVPALSGCAATVQPNRIASPDQPPQKNFLLPAVEVVAMNAVVNLAGRGTKYAHDLRVTFGTIKRNLASHWVQDRDPFEINQLLHPFQGAMYHSMARSSGLNYWQAAAYTFAGSALWEIAGERTPPSRNDQVASGLAGSFFGEPLFRSAQQLLTSGDGTPGFWRTLAATVSSPPTVINRQILGDRFDSERPGATAAIDVRLDLGVMGPQAKPAAAFLMDHDISSTSRTGERRPFDHFRLEGRVSSTGFEQLASRGVIAGRDYGAGVACGVWGIYGGYDYFAPDVFRLSSTTVSAGTSAAWHWPSVTLQTTALIGVGYTAIQPRDVTEDRTTRYDAAPQVLAALQATASRRVVLDLTARQYVIGDGAGFGARPRETVFRGDAALMLRLVERHGVTLTFTRSQRSVSHAALPLLTSGRSSAGIFYTIVPSGFGAAR